MKILIIATGGLKDTVIDPEEKKGQGTGFKFDRFQAEDLVEGVKRAVKIFELPDVWQGMMWKAMDQDFSWHRSAKEYLRLFERTLAGGDN
jgi:starch synthase